MKTILLIITILMSGLSFSQNWSQISDFDGSARDDGTSFKIDNKVYCGTGRNAGFSVTSDLKRLIYPMKRGLLLLQCPIPQSDNMQRHSYTTIKAMFLEE